MAVSQERRQYPRAKVTWPVIMKVPRGHMDWWTVRQELSGRIEDISATGAFICCQEPLNLNEEFSMAISDVPPLNRQVPVIAEVVRSNIYCVDDEGMYNGMGVRFTWISKDDHQLITTLVSDHLKSKTST